MNTPANRQIGEFTLDEQIGASDIAAVYRAYQPTINRYVALKVINLPADTTGTSTLIFERRFTQEAQVLTSLEHPHIVPIYHYGIVKNQCAYIAMRLMHGTLSEMLEEAPMSQERVIDITTQLIAGLGYAHSKGMIHLGIKPENVLFDEAGSACLADFGLMRVSDQQLDTTKPTALKHTLLYVAPEQITSDTADNRADIYSLGVLMYQMLTGRVPFDDENIGLRALLDKIESEEPTLPRQINPDIHPDLERIVMQALRKEPRERFFDMEELADALSKVPGTRTRVRGRRAQPKPARLRPALSPTRRRVYRIGFVVLQIVIAIGLVVLVYELSQAPAAQPVATVVTGVQGNVEAAVPSGTEITRAQTRLGSKGFIAYIGCSLASEFEAARADDMSTLATTYGVRFQTYDSRGDAYIQLTLIEQARLAGAQAIILCPLQPSVLAESLTSVRSADIPLILTDALENSYGGVMVEQDNEQAGLLAGRFVGEKLAEAGKAQPNIAILDEPTYSFSEGRVEGFLQGLREHVPDARIAGRLPGGADSSTSHDALARFLLGTQSIDAVFAVTDSGAYGAIDALSNSGLSPDAVIVASINGESHARDEVSSGHYLQASVDISREAGSVGVFDAAVKLLGGGEVPEILILPSGNLITHDIIEQRPPQNGS